MWFRQLVIFSAPFLGISCALAQTDAGSLLKQQEQIQQRPPAFLPQASVEETRAPLKVGAGETVLIKSIRFSGATELVPEAELQGMVADAIDKHLDFIALQTLTDRITSHLKKRGWFLAYAYLPAQDVTAGDIEIAIVAGRLSKREPVSITSGDQLVLRMHTDRLGAIAARKLPPGAVAREDDLNRAVLLINDLPGITARARLAPGDQPGETRVHLTIDEGPLLSGNFAVDNFGSRDTGTDQLTMSLALSDPMRIGDQFSLGVTASEGTTIGRLGYSLPLWGSLGSDGWKFNFAYTGMRYEVRTATGHAAGLEGESQTISANIMYPWLRGRTANIYFNLGQTHKALIDTSSLGTLRDKRIDATMMTLSGDRLDNLGGGGLTSWSVGLVAGQLDLALPADAATDAATYRSAGAYQKLSYSLARLQKLPGPFTLFASLIGQEASKNLDSSEKFYLGGPSGVRAYSGAEAGGDSAQSVSLEVRYDWPATTPLGQLQLLAFYDQGWTTLHHEPGIVPITTASGSNRYTISGTGIGLSMVKPGQQVIRASIAHKLGSNPGRSLQDLDADGQADNNRLWLQATFLF